MINKKILLLSSFVLFQLCVWGQKQTEFYPELFSMEVIKKATKLEKSHPLEFFGAATEYYKDGKMNDAGFLYYLGDLRYRYYIATHLDEKPDGERAIFASLKSTIGSEINYRLGEDIDNYPKILDAVIEWRESNDFKFYSRKESPAKSLFKNWGIAKKRSSAYLVSDQTYKICNRNLNG